MADDDIFYEIIPEGYEWGILMCFISCLAMFNWDFEKSSKKLGIEED
jgi:hypothetical protein